MTSAPSFRLLPVEATEAMRDAASAAVIAEWRAMIKEHLGEMSVGDMARSFVSPGNYRLVLAAIKGALSAAPVMAEATGWQDMATAPKDGTPILVWWSTTPPAAFETYWHSDESQGDKPGWYGPGWGHILDGRIELGWMPLPSLPDPPALNASLAIAAGQLAGKESGE